MEKLKSAYPKMSLLHDAKIHDDSVESIRTYLMSLIRINQ
jgi:hypothetical protein